jgi:hypothetical protein
MCALVAVADAPSSGQGGLSVASDGVDVRLIVPSPADGATPSAQPTPGVPAAGPPPGTVTDLPRTGVELAAVALIAVALLVLGVLLVKAGRVRRRRSARTV